MTNSRCTPGTSGSGVPASLFGKPPRIRPFPVAREEKGGRARLRSGEGDSFNRPDWPAAAAEAWKAWKAWKAWGA